MQFAEGKRERGAKPQKWDEKPAHICARANIRAHTRRATRRGIHVRCVSSIDMYDNDVGKESAQKFMKQTGDIKAATLYFAS
jgi:hypothetical protein